MLKEKVIKDNRFYNVDFLVGCENVIDDNSVDLILTDPPYGISGDKLDRHYNRDEKYVLIEDDTWHHMCKSNCTNKGRETPNKFLTVEEDVWEYIEKGHTEKC